MPTVAEIEQVLRGVMDPELGADVVELGMVKGIEFDTEGVVRISLALTIAGCPMRGQIEADVRRKLSGLPSVRAVEVSMGEMTPEERAQLMATARYKAREKAPATMLSPFTRVLAVGSGKGGVGKSTMAVNLALAISDLGFATGILDADIWGFSVPRMLGVGDRLVANPERKIIPQRAHGIEVVSTGLLVSEEDKALMWRGLMLAKALEQFLHDVAWGKLDYLVVDLPPGTGDVQMALARLLPQAEMLVVTTPQLAAQRVAARAADMARRSFMPVIGVIENMAGFTTDDGVGYSLFGEGGGQELADGLGIPLIAQVPIDPRVVAGGDEGNPVVRAQPDSPAARAIAGAAKLVVELLPPSVDETCTARIDRLFEGLQAARA